MDAERAESPPPFPYNNAAGREVANAGKPLAALKGDTSQVLERLRNGERVKDVAAGYGVTSMSMYEWLLCHSPSEWLSISAGRSLAKMDDAEDDLTAATDKLDVMKARESRRMNEWTLERAARKLYGDTKPDSAGLTIQVLIARDGVPQARIIDGEAEPLVVLPLRARDPLCEFTAAPQHEPLGSDQASGPPTTTCGVEPPVAGSALHHGDA